LSNEHNHIDPLQRALKDRFVDFEHQVDIDMTSILNASKPSINPKPFSNLSKLLLGGTAVIGGIAIYFALSTEEKSITKKPVFIEKTISNPIINTDQNTELVKETTPPITKNSTALKSINKQTNTIKSEEIIHQKNTPEIKTEETDPIIEHKDFEHFINKKTKNNSDSIELFIKKK
jgi:hypothetical protein